MRNYVKFSDIKCERQPLLFSNPNPEIEHNFHSDAKISITHSSQENKNGLLKTPQDIENWVPHTYSDLGALCETCITGGPITNDNNDGENFYKSNKFVSLIQTFYQFSILSLFWFELLHNFEKTEMS